MELGLVLRKEFTPQQRAFVDEIIGGSDIGEAAAKAGYGNENSGAIGSAMLQHPAILAAVQIGVAKQLALAAPVALKLLKRFVADETIDKRLRVVCAKTLLDRAGHIAPKAIAASSGAVVPLNEMTMTDLRALADKLEGEIAGRAKEVSSASKAAKQPQTIEDIM